MSKRIVILGGDGVGPEVSEVAGNILEQMRLDLEIVKPPCGEAAQKDFGTVFPEETRKLCAEADAVLFGAAGRASVPILVHLRWEMDNYVNIRPVKHYRGAASPLKDPEGIDFVILRENSEGFYPPGREGDILQLAEKWPEWTDSLLAKRFQDYGPGKFAIRIVTVRGVNRMMEFACHYARQRKALGFAGKLTCVTKSNVLEQSCGLFQRAAERETANHPDLLYEHYYIDDAARRLLRYPKDMDVIVTSNMFGDILADEAAELVGGLGIAPSACIGGTTPYFEPVHGSAPKYAGRNMINPTAAILSSKMMLEFLGLQIAAEALEKAVAAVYQEGRALTRDQGGTATTAQFGRAVLKKIQ